jgi:hypothetical protein
MLQHDRQRPPVALGLVGVVPLAWRRLDEDRVVAPAHALGARIVEEGVLPRLVGVAVDVVRQDERGAFEVFAPEVDVARARERALVRGYDGLIL